MKVVYSQLRSAVLSRAEELPVFDPDGRVREHASDIFVSVRQDDPYLFHLSKILEGYGDGDDFVFIPNYLFKKSRERSILKRIERIAGEMLKDLPDSVFEKEVEIYKRVVESITYPKDYEDGVKREEHQTIVGSMLNGEAVCSGTAGALNLLFNRAGIRCGTMRGTSREGAGHSWNVVELGGKRYHLDATGDTMGNTMRFEAFNITDELCRSLGYSWKSRFECNDPMMEFYTYNKCRVNAADVERFVLKKLEEGAIEVVFRITDMECWSRETHADVIISSLSEAPLKTASLKVSEEGFARLTVVRLRA
ncbi:MAG: hypothetical protein LBR42_02285 [Candidatus Methanoplasma sp.]|jgi:hypothetical protein|nr:hypothetical protein [Candidatus Methanoplasma sp.]